MKENENFCVLNNVSHVEQNVKVFEFFTHDLMTWDEDKVKSSFDSSDVNAIITT